MAQRDYVDRGRSSPRRKKNNRRNSPSSISKAMIALAITIVVIFVSALYFIVHNSPNSARSLKSNHPAASNSLPPKPEERWSYIKELESRQVTGGIRPAEQPLTDNKELNNHDLSEEQRQLLEQMQADMRQPPIELVQVPSIEPSNKPASVESSRQKTEPIIQQTVPTVATAPPIDYKPMEHKSDDRKSDNRKLDEHKSKQERKIDKKQNEQWSLQCGAFANHNQAEQARITLAFAGIESRVSKNNGWYRVTIGPYQSRETANKTHQQVKKTKILNCITLGTNT